MQYGLEEVQIEKINKIFSEIEKVEQVIIFGSRAKGNHKASSDIDLALKGNWITLDDILMLSNRIDALNLIYKFDLINYSTIDNQDLVEHIDRVGKIFYTKKG